MPLQALSKAVVSKQRAHICAVDVCDVNLRCGPHTPNARHGSWEGAGPWWVARGERLKGHSLSKRRKTRGRRAFFRSSGARGQANRNLTWEFSLGESALRPPA